MLLDHHAKLVRFLSTNIGSHLAGWSVAALTDIGYHVDLTNLDGGAGKNENTNRLLHGRRRRGVVLGASRHGQYRSV